MIQARFWVVGVVIALTVALGAMIPQLKADFTPSDLFAAFGDSRQVADDFKADFGNTDNVILFLYEDDNVMSPDSVGLIYELTQRVRTVDGVIGVQSVVSLPRPSESILAQLNGDAAPADVPEGDEPVTESIFDLYELLSGVTWVGDQHASPDDSAPANDRAGSDEGTSRFQPIISSSDVSPEDAALLDKVVSLSRAVDGRLVSHDRTVASLVVTLAPTITKNDALAVVVKDFEEVIREFEVSHPGEQVSLGGLPYIRTSIVRTMGADQKVLLPASIIVSLLILLLAFRWLPALFLPTVAVAVSAVSLVGGMALFGVKLNILNNIIPTLVVIIGISNSIHIINRYRDNIGKGLEKHAAAADAMATMVLACFLTSVTTAVGFASLGVSQTTILRSFGLTAAVGVMIAYVAAVTFVPAALSMVKPIKVAADANRATGFDNAMGSMSRVLMKQRWTVLLLSVAMIALALVFGFRTKIDSAVLDQVSPKDEVYRTTRLIEQKLGGIRPLEIYIRGEEPWSVVAPDTVAGLHEIVDYAAAQEGVLTTLGYFDLVGQVQVMLSGDLDAAATAMDDPEQVRGLVSLLAQNPQNPLAGWLLHEGKTARIQVMVEDMGALKTNELLDRLEARIAERFADTPGLSVRLTGDAYIGSRGLDAVISDLISSLATAVVIIFILMTLLFRSVRAGLISIPPALMPLAFTLFWMWARGIPLNTATAIIFSIAIGMTIDGCIHIIARFREEYVGDKPLEEAIVDAVRGTGKAIVFTCLALIVGFAVMLVSNFVPVRRFGELVAFTILIMLIATIGLLPALLRIAYNGVEKRRLEATKRV